MFMLAPFSSHNFFLAHSFGCWERSSRRSHLPVLSSNWDRKQLPESAASVTNVMPSSRMAMKVDATERRKEGFQRADSNCLERGSVSPLCSSNYGYLLSAVCSRSF